MYKRTKFLFNNDRTFKTVAIALLETGYIDFSVYNDGYERCITLFSDKHAKELREQLKQCKIKFEELDDDFNSLSNNKDKLLSDLAMEQKEQM